MSQQQEQRSIGATIIGCGSNIVLLMTIMAVVCAPSRWAGPPRPIRSPVCACVDCTCTDCMCGTAPERLPGLDSARLGNGYWLQTSAHPIQVEVDDRRRAKPSDPPGLFDDDLRWLRANRRKVEGLFDLNLNFSIFGVYATWLWWGLMGVAGVHGITMLLLVAAVRRLAANGGAR